VNEKITENIYGLGDGGNFWTGFGKGLANSQLPQEISGIKPTPKEVIGEAVGRILGTVGNKIMGGN